ncbi:hypothetical protein SISSUDRAFT_1044422 [Sistotremastrum suecicum HHB10207 ss-3]|uniref:Uncharacterized protein n=1 Tax=Sistotremastrum suecicum HHB10207 ss-3 TaxID=1314776 RepID=A0A166F732_9AGAM|nr:hypothetical protein SISSUDRAFT_1044422 [Sistotremastrum suecicum HHB10207 ss-3]
MEMRKQLNSLTHDAHTHTEVGHYWFPKQLAVIISASRWYHRWDLTEGLVGNSDGPTRLSCPLNLPGSINFRFIRDCMLLTT